MQANKYTDYMYSSVKKVIDEIGPRPSCSERERKLGRLLLEEWKPICDRVSVETFTCSPSAFLGSIPLSVLLYFAAVILYWFLPPASLAIVIISASILFLELRYHEFVDYLFPQKRGDNVVGVIHPRSEPGQRVIVSAHLDSAYEFNLFYYLKNNATIMIIAIALVGFATVFGASLARTVAYFSASANEFVFTVIGLIIIVLSPATGLLLFFHTYKPVPGAMDNMAGIAVVAGLGKYLDDARTIGNWFPERTEVLLLATSSEESGLRGAKRYAKRHFKECKAIPTYGLFLDGIYDEKFLTVVDREIFTGAKHDLELVKLAQDAAAAHNWPITVKPIPVGASDASAFSVKGIASTCLLCQDISRIVPNYHTRNDTYEHVRPESLAVSLQLVIDMIERIDKK